MDDFKQEWSAFCAAHGTPDNVELMLCDVNAILRGKWLPGDQIDKFEAGSLRLPMSTYAPNILGEEVEATGLGISKGDPDGMLQPVVGSLKTVPWADGKTAQMQVEMVENDGQINALSSREKLRDILDRFAALGLYPVVASELEFYLLKPRKAPSDPPTPPDLSPNAQNYDLEVLARSETVLNDILQTAQDQGMSTDTLIAEYGPGQFEVNFHHTNDVLAAADTALMFRRLVRAVAAQNGYEATFMAKPYADFPGNGMHLHVSVLDANGKNIFNADEGVSSTLDAAVAGVLATMDDMQAIFAPHLNSYRRFQPESFAPSSPDWGLDHRGAAVRLPQTTGPAARLEHRICGADVNPYLAFTAILGGILHGLENKLSAPLPIDDPNAKTAEPLTQDWQAAVNNFATSGFAKDLFGAEFQRVYSTLRQDEIAQITRPISEVEYRYYLSRF